MYIQQDQGVGIPFTVPKGYSGSAFQEPHQETKDAEEASPPAPRGEDTPPKTDEGTEVAAEEAPSAPVGAFGKLPFLSALLPPPRKKKEGSGLPEWALVALIFFILNDTRDGDLLPILLLLLLWD